jgi:ATP-binding cassette subfamily B (MDR/TAP) protein 1
MVVHAFSANARLEEKFIEFLNPGRIAGICTKYPPNRDIIK